MTTPLDSSIVRILSVDTRVIGAGFLVAERHVLTCAHVIVDALGLPQDSFDRPSDFVHLDFPLVAAGQILTAYIVLWSWAEDIAGLKLVSPPPSGAQTAQLITAQDLWGHPFRTYGFPRGHDLGVWASGVLRSKTGTGWLQIEDVKEEGYRIQPGFSGGPVWDEELEGTVGMVVAAERKSSIKAAFMVPAYTLTQVWPELPLHKPLANLNNVPPLPPHYLERVRELVALKAKLLTSTAEPIAITGYTEAVGVQGMAGIGKSVLAIALARDYELRQTFHDGVFWLTLGRSPDVVARLDQLAQVLDDTPQVFNDVQQGQASLSKLLAGKACLLVLDDAWSSTHVEPFLNAVGTDTHSRVLITTRDSGLVSLLGAQEYVVDILDVDAALTLLADWVESTVNDLPKLAREVAKECGLLPLALAMVGAMVRNGLSWHNVLKRLHNADLKKIRQQFANYPYPNLLRAIQVSVDALADLEQFYDLDIQARYLDFAIFREDTPIPHSVLQTYWATELDEDEVEEIVNVLVARSLVQRNDEGTLILHDLQLDYIRNRIVDLSGRHDDLLKVYRKKCEDGWHMGPNDGYFFENLAFHLREAGHIDELNSLLTGSPAWMETKFIACGGDISYVADLELALNELADPLLNSELLTLVQLNSARQVVNARISLYSNTDLEILVLLGREVEALTHARLRSGGKFSGLITIDRALRKKSKPNPKLLDEAIQASKAIKADREPILRTLTEALAEASRFDEAIAIAKSIKTDSWRKETLKDLAATLAEAKRFDLAGEVARSIQDDKERFSTLRDIATALIRDDCFNEARQPIRDIRDDWGQAYAICNLAKALAGTGRFDESYKTIREIPKITQQVEALCTLATTLTEAEQPEHANQVFAEVKKITESIPDAYSRENSLSKLVESLVDAGRFDEASEVTRNMVDDWKKAHSLRLLSTKLAEAGCFAEAGEVARGIHWDHGQRAGALYALAIELEEVDQTNLAETAFAEAREAARAIQDDRYRSEVQRDLAMALIRIGRFFNAREVAKENGSIYWQTKILCTLATNLLEAGLIADAESVFDEVSQVARSTRNNMIYLMVFDYQIG